MHRTLVAILLFLPLIANAQWQNDTDLIGVNATDAMIFDDKLYTVSNNYIYESSDRIQWQINVNGFEEDGLIDRINHSGGNIIASGFDGIFTSIDSGKTWIQTYEISGRRTQKILSSEEIAIVLTEDAMYISLNRGLDWREVFSDLFTGGTDLDITSSGRLILSDRKKLFYSDDTTKTWTEIENFYPENNGIESLFTYGDTILVGGSSGLGISDDNGQSWNVGRAFNGGIYSLFMNDDFVFVGSYDRLNILNRSDSSRSWYFIDDVGFGHSKLTSDGTAYYCMTSTQIITSQDGDNWHAINTGINGFGVEGITSTDSSVVVYSSLDMMTRSLEGTQWSVYKNGLDGRINHVDMNHGFTSTTKGFFQIIDNRWEQVIQWNQIMDIPVNPGIRTFRLYDDQIVGGTIDGLYTSQDNGASWQFLGTWKEPGSTNASLADLMKLGDSIVVPIDPLRRSFDNGVTWQKIGEDFSSFYRQIIHNNGALMAAGRHIILSFDFGDSWIDIRNNLKDDYRYYVTEAELIGNNLFICLQRGIYVAAWNDVLENPTSFEWHKVGEGLDQVSSRSMEYRNGKLYSGTFYRGLWSLDFELNEPPTLDEISLSNVDQYSAPGTPVDTLLAIDTDGEQEFSYQILSGNEQQLFFIDETSGVIFTTDDGPFLPDQTSYQLTVKVRDDGVPPMSTTTKVNIEVNEVVLGIEESFQDLLLFPNPSSGKITVRLPVLPDPHTEVVIYDLSGKVLRSYFFESRKDHLIDCSDLKKGLYIFHFSNASEQLFREVLVK